MISNTINLKEGVRQYYFRISKLDEVHNILTESTTVINHRVSQGTSETYSFYPT